MSISEFRTVGQMRNAHVFLDSGTDRLKVRRQDVFHRAVNWIREKVAPNPLARTEQEAVHNRFLRAIAGSLAYDRGDVSRAEALLSVDLLEGKPLSSRRIREVIQDLDGRSTEAMRENRTTVAWMSGRGVEERLREQDAVAAVSDDEREMLAGRVGEAIHAAGGDGRRRVEFAEASKLTHGVVDEFLQTKADEARAAAEARVRAEAEARAQAEAEARARAETAAAAVARRGVDTQPTPRSRAATAAPSGKAARESAQTRATGAVGEARQPEPASRKQLQGTLRKAKLPGAVRAVLTKLIKTGEIADRNSLARRGNRQTADWVMENRVGRWYGEAQERVGARKHIKDGEMLMASTTMLREVRESIASAEELLAYPDVKSQARALIAEHARSEVARQSS